jgi:hypothetical protein
VANTSSLRFELDMVEALGRRLQPDAMIVQEDRNLVMASAGVLDLDADNGLDAAYLAIAEHRPLPLGRYLLLRSRGGEAYWTYQAVVHDLETKDSVKRGMTSVTVEPLGVWRNRGLTIEEMVEAFEASVFEVCVGLGSQLRMTLLLENMDSLEEVSHLLRSRLLRKASRSFRTVDGEAALVEVKQRGCRLHCRFVPGSLSGYSVSCVDRPY